jgi:hypothetical protein
MANATQLSIRRRNGAVFLTSGLPNDPEAIGVWEYRGDDRGFTLFAQLAFTIVPESWCEWNKSLLIR